MKQETNSTITGQGNAPVKSNATISECRIGSERFCIIRGQDQWAGFDYTMRCMGDETMEQCAQRNIAEREERIARDMRFSLRVETALAKGSL